MKNKTFNSQTTSFSKDNLAYLAHCAHIAYEYKDLIRIELEKLDFNLRNFFFIEDKKSDTQCFVTGDNEKIIISFRGPEAHLQDWKTDFSVKKVSWEEKKVGRIHEGFYKALNSVWKKLEDEIDNLRTNGQSIWFTGHSLGGALALLAAATLHLKKGKYVHGVYTFGQPRTGDSDFAKLYDQSMKERTYVLVNNNDIVTRVPQRLIDYSHSGRLFYFSSEGELHEDDQFSWWDKFWDRASGIAQDFPNFKLDSIKDHKMEIYQELCKKAAGWI